MYSDEITISIKGIKQEEEKEKQNNEDQVFQELKEQEQENLNEQMLAIKMSDDYYMIVGKSKLNEVYKSEQQW